MTRLSAKYCANAKLLAATHVAIGVALVAVPTLLAWSMRRRWTKGIAVALAMCSCGFLMTGCAPLHAGMSETRIREVIDQAAPTGTPRNQVMDRTARYASAYGQPQVDWVDRDPRPIVRVMLPGFYGFLCVKECVLTFHFDDEQRLTTYDVEYGVSGL